MKQFKRSDIPLLVSIKKKKCHMEQIENIVTATLSEAPDYSSGASELGYALMEQLDTLNQIKELACSICNDNHEDL